MEKYEIEIQSKAHNDLNEIMLYISETLHEPSAAFRIYSSFKEQISSLSQMPSRYAVVSEEPYATMGIRRISVGNYSAYYYIEKSEHIVYILRFAYNRREWQSLL